MAGRASVVARAAPESRALDDVVAQSLGAFAGPLVAEQISAALLVLLAPMVPVSGETAGEWWQNTGRPEAIAHLTERFGPMADWGQEAFEEVFLHDVDPAVAPEAGRVSGAPRAGMFS